MGSLKVLNCNRKYIYEMQIACVREKVKKFKYFLKCIYDEVKKKNEDGIFSSKI